jgi:hypothetical protein
MTEIVPYTRPRQMLPRWKVRETWKNTSGVTEIFTVSVDGDLNDVKAYVAGLAMARPGYSMTAVKVIDPQGIELVSRGDQFVYRRVIIQGPSHEV